VRRRAAAAAAERRCGPRGRGRRQSGPVAQAAARARERGPWQPRRTHGRTRAAKAHSAAGASRPGVQSGPTTWVSTPPIEPSQLARGRAPLTAPSNSLRPLNASARATHQYPTAPSAARRQGELPPARAASAGNAAATSTRPSSGARAGSDHIQGLPASRQGTGAKAIASSSAVPSCPAIAMLETAANARISQAARGASVPARSAIDATANTVVPACGPSTDDSAAALAAARPAPAIRRFARPVSSAGRVDATVGGASPNASDCPRSATRARHAGLRGCRARQDRSRARGRSPG
jgi:hypothetical protein